MTDHGELQQNPQAEMDEAVKRGKAIAKATAVGNERQSDQEAFGAFVLAVKTAMSNKSREGADGAPTFTFSDGRGLLRNNGADRLIFYLNDGYLIAKMPPVPSPQVIPYVRQKQGQMLSWYQFSLKQETFNELQMAEQLVAIAY